MCSVTYNPQPFSSVVLRTTRSLLTASERSTAIGMTRGMIGTTAGGGARKVNFVVKHQHISIPPRSSLMPSRSPHVRERGSGVLNDFSCHMGQGSSMIRELESDSRTRNYMCRTQAIVF